MMMRNQWKFYWLLILAVIATGFAAANPSMSNAAISDNGATPVWSEDTVVGKWKSVDYVRAIGEFQSDKIKWEGDLFLKEFRCSADGLTSLGWTCKDGWVVHSNGKTKYRYFLKTLNSSEYLFLPWLTDDVTLRGLEPFYYVLQRVNGQGSGALTKSNNSTAKVAPSSNANMNFQEVVRIDQVEPFMDVRWKDMSYLDLTGKSDLLQTLRFNEKTIWPARKQMPEGDSPAQLMVNGMNPGLGVRELHRQGITGKGVNVAIIDQPLYLDHPEYAGKIIAYHDVGCKSESSMHGPAVASLFVGSECGTAPGARVFFVAAPSWTKDSAFPAKALQWLIDQNEKLSAADKIRVVSVSGAPSGPGSLFNKNQEMWDEACRLAEQKGILVLDCTKHRGFIGPCYYDANDPENVSKCIPGFPGIGGRMSTTKLLLVPCSPRTTAEEYDKGKCSYQYCGRGGLSWSIPYCAGVLALGWQLNPKLNAQQMKDILFQSAYVNKDGAQIIDPKNFIQKIKATADRNARELGITSLPFTFFATFERLAAAHLMSARIDTDLLHCTAKRNRPYVSLLCPQFASNHANNANGWNSTLHLKFR
jgi:serine protease AprX